MTIFTQMARKQRVSAQYVTGNFPTAASGFVYFIRCGRALKIGFANDPIGRMSDLQVANAKLLTLLGAVPGGYEDERQIRDLFSAHRLKGEWVNAARVVMNEVRSLLKQRGVPIQRLQVIHRNRPPFPVVESRSGDGADAVRRALATTAALRAKFKAEAGIVPRRQPRRIAMTCSHANLIDGQR